MPAGIQAYFPGLRLARRDDGRMTAGVSERVREGMREEIWSIARQLGRAVMSATATNTRLLG